MKMRYDLRSIVFDFFISCRSRGNTVARALA